MKSMIKFLTISTLSAALGFSVTVTSFSLLAGFDGAQAPGGAQTGGAPGGYNYIGKGNEIGKPDSKGQKSGESKAEGGKQQGKGK